MLNFSISAFGLISFLCCIVFPGSPSHPAPSSVTQSFVQSKRNVFLVSEISRLIHGVPQDERDWGTAVNTVESNTGCVVPATRSSFISIVLFCKYSSADRGGISLAFAMQGHLKTAQQQMIAGPVRQPASWKCLITARTAHCIANSVRYGFFFVCLSLYERKRWFPFFFSLFNLGRNNSGRDEAHFSDLETFLVDLCLSRIRVLQWSKISWFWIRAEWFMLTHLSASKSLYLLRSARCCHRHDR